MASNAPGALTWYWQDPQRLHAGLSVRSHSSSHWGELIGDEDTVRPSWRHEELGRNDPAAHAMNGEAAVDRNE